MADLDLDEGRAGRTDGASSSETAATAVGQALQGAVYPLSRDGVVLVARENEADAALLGTLSTLPAQSYRSPDEVIAALGRPS